MRATALLAAVASAGLAASAPPALQVLRTSPDDGAEPTSTITVTFDRPVAGALDSMVDPRAIFSIRPAVEGRVEWRDPITLRFRPNAPLTSGTTYTVTIANTFSAMDGARLDQPFQFSFRVGGPRPLDGTPVGTYTNPQYLERDVEFDVLVSAPVDLAVASRLVRLDLIGTCANAGPVRLTAVSQRPITDRDPQRYRYAGRWDRDQRADALRRVVHFRPERPLPAGCQGAIIMPGTLDEASTERPQQWGFATYGPFRLSTVSCSSSPRCPAGFLRVHFTTPVKGSLVQRAVRLRPAAPFVIADTADEQASWSLEVPLRTRTQYTVTVDPSLRDVFNQPLTGPTSMTYATTGYAAALEHATGRLLVERQSFRTMAVRHVNVDTLNVQIAPVPESLEARVLATPSWNADQSWDLVQSGVTERKIPLRRALDTPLVSAVRLPVFNAARPGSPSLMVVRIRALQRDSTVNSTSGTAIVQVTNLGVAARLGQAEAVAWVTNVDDGLPRRGAAVTLYDRRGRVRARATTDERGLAHMRNLPPDSGGPERGGFEGYVAVRYENDRAVVAFDQYAWELSPWRFNVSAGYGNDRIPAAAAVFTERGIYRPGESVYAKAIVRTGMLGALRAPQRGDSLRWVFHARDEGTLRDTTVALSAFGTSDAVLRLTTDQALGFYRVGVQLKRDGEWTELSQAYYRVAEYRPPEFLVNVTADTTARFGGDTVTATVEARYLFGAVMGRAAVTWTARLTPSSAWALRIPGADDYQIGQSGYWWEEDEDRVQTRTLANVTDTLDAAGRLVVRVPVGAPPKGQPAFINVQATITDVNRQTVSASSGATVHPASFYVGARDAGEDYFWRAGTAVQLNLIAVRPDGRRVPGVAVRGTIVSREWHRVQRRRDGVDERVGDWVSDTVATCDVTTAAEPMPCRFTPARGGTYIVTFRARDERGREAATSFYRWATGRDWVPWGDENEFKMDLIPDKTRYNVGDTATVLLASPFTDAEAWVTIEREGIIEQRRIRIAAGATSISIPLTEAHVPNAFVSVIVARGRSAAAGGIADPGRPTIRVGYAELNVEAAVKRLRVDVEPLATEYRPGQTARVRLRVRDARGTGRAAEVTLWAVDEGVLSLTGYRTPDPLALLYRARGVGMRLASDLISVAPQVLEEEGVSLKGERAPGGGGGQDGGDILRSRFSSTAFFLGSVITDSTGAAEASARLPDNLTTFRVMAVAVTNGDRYGSGESSMLVTRPLLARPALPRFLRRDDRFIAGIVVNQRAGGTPTVRAAVNARGVTLTDSAIRRVTLEAGRGTEVRWVFRDTTADTASFRFDVSSGRDSDAVLARLPIRPSHTPRAHTAAGVVQLTSGIELALPGDIDPARSTLVFSIGTSPLALIGGMYRQLAIYPFACTEQLTSELLPLVALHRGGSTPEGRRYAPANAAAQIAEAVQILSRRQRADGGIGLWDASDWTTPWLSAYAGEALLRAREAGIAVNDSVLSRLAEYLTRSLHDPQRWQSPVFRWQDLVHIRLAEQVAALEYLSRYQRPDVPGENEMLRLVPQMAWEDRVRLAEILSRRNAAAARRLLEPIWAGVRLEGRRAVVPDSAVREFYFWSSRRPVARLLSATLAVDPAHPLIGPLVETLIQRGSGANWWNTQDYGAAVEALADFSARQQRAASRGFTVAAAGRVLFRTTGQGDVPREQTRDLTGLISASGDTARLTLTIAAPSGADASPLYYHVTVHEVPRNRPVTPDQKGIAVERWYEDYRTGRPITSIEEGNLVRVRLRITLRAERSFLALTDPLPAGLEAVDLSLRTAGELPGPAAGPPSEGEQREEGEEECGYRWGWYYGSWDAGWWSPFDHREMRDDRVAWVATYLWPGTYTATYVARATTPGVFIRPPAHAEEMYNPSVQGRSDGGTFTVTRRR